MDTTTADREEAILGAVKAALGALCVVVWLQEEEVAKRAGLPLPQACRALVGLRALGLAVGTRSGLWRKAGQP